MANEDVATRAPESDAQQGTSSSPQKGEAQVSEKPVGQINPSSMLENDTPAQTGPTMGEHCTTDRPLPSSSSSPTGEETTVNNIPCYISKPPSYPQEPGKLLLLLTGGTGIQSANNKLQADAYAARGFLVVMPDQFNGDPAPNGTVSEEDAAAAASAAEDRSLLERIKLGAAETAKSFLIDMWLARHGAEKVLPILQKVIAGAKEEFADAVASGGGIYGAGYCFGAKYILLLCGSAPDSVKQGQTPVGQDGEPGEVVKGPELKVGAIAHGTLVTKEDIEGVKSPICMACVSSDNLFPDDIREQGRASLELNSVEHTIKIYEGVPHGFAVVGDYRDEKIQAARKEAFEMMAGWLESH